MSRRTSGCIEGLQHMKEPTKRQFDAAERRFGRNVKLRAIFKRHGEKEHKIGGTGETSLTENGRAESMRYGQQLETTNAIKSYSSPTERTRDTGDLVVEGAPAERKLKSMVKEELALNFDPDGELSKEYIRLQHEILGSDFKAQGAAEQEKRQTELDTQYHDLYLSYGNEAPPGVELSPNQIADQIAKRIKTYLQMAERLYNNYEATLINATHDLCIAAFVKKIIGFESVREIGGPIKFNEGFEVLINTDDQGEQEAKMIFRDQEYSLEEII